MEPFFVPPRTEEFGLPSYFFFLAFFFAFVFFFAPHLPQDMLLFLLFGLLRDQALLYDASVPIQRAIFRERSALIVTHPCVHIGFHDISVFSFVHDSLCERA